MDYQLPLLQKIQHKYKTRVILSSWSPPYQMKFDDIDTGSGPFGVNFLRSKNYSHFAQYIADYLSFYQSNKLEIYAISPQNEPEFPVPSWEGCVWMPYSLAKFIRDYLKPTLHSKNINVKVMGPENANTHVSWFYSMIMKHCFKHDNGIDIYASHG